MALTRYAPLVSIVRGRIGATTFTRSLGGPTIRSAPYPRRRSTSRRPFDYQTYGESQAYRRATLAVLASHWLIGLTIAQRAAWAALATATRLINRLGEPIQTTGRALFIRSNVLRGLFVPAINDDPPAQAVCQMPRVLVSWDAVWERFDLDVQADFIGPEGMLYYWVSPAYTYARNANPSTFYLGGGPDLDRLPVVVSNHPTHPGWQLCMAYFWRFRVVTLLGAVSHPIVIRAISD